MTHISIQCIHEENPGQKWSGLFHAKWPYYEAWYIRNGGSKKGYLTSSNMLKENMPELFPVYEQLLVLSGGGDAASRFLTMYCPPPFMRGCSQAILRKKNATSLIRNYEYIPGYFEGALLYTNWLQPVIGVSDCLWGMLDGMNDSGLVASLAFGGNNIVEEGFGIPLIMRYILETAHNVDEAIHILEKIPSHMAYNVALCDASGNAATVFLKPGGGITVTGELVCTNQQEKVIWDAYHIASKSAERKALLENLIHQKSVSGQKLSAAMLRPPLYVANDHQNWSTLYTSAYNCNKKEMIMMWPFAKMKQSFTQFNETVLQIELNRSKAYH